MTYLDWLNAMALGCDMGFGKRVEVLLNAGRHFALRAGEGHLRRHQRRPRLRAGPDQGATVLLVEQNANAALKIANDDIVCKLHLDIA